MITQLSLSLSHTQEHTHTHTHTHNDTDRSIKTEKWCTVVSEVIPGVSFNPWTNKDIGVHFIWQWTTSHNTYTYVHTHTHTHTHRKDLATAAFILSEPLFSPV